MSDGWFQCESYPPAGIYMMLGDECDDEPERVVVRCGAVFDMEGNRKIVYGCLWKKIGGAVEAHLVRFKDRGKK